MLRKDELETQQQNLEEQADGLSGVRAVEKMEVSGSTEVFSIECKDYFVADYNKSIKLQLVISTMRWCGLSALIYGHVKRPQLCSPGETTGRPKRGFQRANQSLGRGPS